MFEGEYIVSFLECGIIEKRNKKLKIISMHYHTLQKIAFKKGRQLKKKIMKRKLLFVVLFFLFLTGSIGTSVFVLQTGKDSVSNVTSSELNIAEVSPDGESAGLVVAASCGTEYAGTAGHNDYSACTSAANACGQTNAGSSLCGGVCSASPPDDSTCAPCYPWGPMSYSPSYGPSFGFWFTPGPWIDWYSWDYWRKPLAHGDSVPYYDAPSVTAPAMCTGGTYTCFNGVLLGHTHGMVTYESCDVIEAFVCTGPIPPNTSVYPKDSTGLTVDTNYSYSATNTAPKCQYSCDGGYEWNGSGCASSASSSCTSNCSTTQNNHCGGATYTGTDSCGNAETCTGTRLCDFNWKEVAP